MSVPESVGGHVYMAPCRFSNLCSFCFLLSLSFLNSSYSWLSVGSSRRHKGQELVLPNHGRMQLPWKKCSQGIFRTVSCSSNSSKHTGHFKPLSACSGVMTTVGRFWVMARAAGGGRRWSQSDTSNGPMSISMPCIRDLASSSKAFCRYCSSGLVGSQSCSSKYEAIPLSVRTRTGVHNCLIIIIIIFAWFVEKVTELLLHSHSTGINKRANLTAW